ncbi:MAG TPA: sugar ABC transporter ATP-binding protein [Anaerolineaceae bacterium]|nr:sugar ABC transporter ATP-binding protein [Anaerolineaceae bacterium]
MTDEAQIAKTETVAGPQPVLEVRHITKRFPGVLALDDVSIQILPGEVHAVVGENGAGKSTLMKIMVGAYTPDQGTIWFQGEKISFAHPIQAQRAGLSIIYQEFNLLPERTVAQNIYLGREPARLGLVDTQQLNQQAADVLKELGAETFISPTAPLNTLSVAEQQMVEIAKAISFDSKVLIMDEPTAALTVTEVNILKDLVNRLKARGLAIVFISHRLIEVFDLADRITVLKDGRLVDTVQASTVRPSKIVHMMVGREIEHYFPPLATPEEIGPVVLRIKNAANKFLNDINLELRTGEIVGVAGLQGSGRTELAQALFGVNPFRTGEMELNGVQVPIRSPGQAIRKGMGFVTEDRKAEGILPNQPVNDNIMLTVRSMQALLTRVLRNGTRRDPHLVPALAKKVDVRVSSFGRELQYLSGGNQQKVVLAKWLASGAKVFIFDEPTRGIDVEAKASIHEMIRDLTRQGAAVLMISSELPEIIGMSDRIVVMWDGTIIGELPAGSKESEIMLMATGQVAVAEDSQHESAAPVEAREEKA